MRGASVVRLVLLVATAVVSVPSWVLAGQFDDRSVCTEVAVGTWGCSGGAAAVAWLLAAGLTPALAVVMARCIRSPRFGLVAGGLAVVLAAQVTFFLAQTPSA